MKKKRIVALLAASAIFMTALAGCGNSSSTSGSRTIDDIKKSGKLSVVTEVAFEPFEYYDTDGTTVIGFGKDLLDYMVADLGVELKQEDLPFQGVLPALEANKCDLVATSTTCTKERADKYSMSIPIADSTVVLIKRYGDESITSVDDMEGRKVGSQTGSGQDAGLEYFNEKMKAEGKQGYSEKKLYVSFPEAYLELQNGNIDFVAQSVSNANVLVKNNPGVYEIVGEVGPKTYFSWVSRKDDPEISDFINSEIKKMKADGTFAELQEKWFGVATDLPEDNYIPEN